MLPSCIFRRLVDLYILPGLGDLKLFEVDRSHVSALHHKYRGKPTQANQAVGVFSKMFKLAVVWGMTPSRPNPCRSVRHYKERGRERFLTPEEYRRLGRVLDEAETSGRFLPSGIAAIRLLVLTGCRKNEIVTLRWDDIDRTAGEIWLRLWPRAGLDDVRIHGARHSYASRALALRESLPMIGHRRVTTTARYAHLARDTEKASAVKV